MRHNTSVAVRRRTPSSLARFGLTKQRQSRGICRDSEQRMGLVQATGVVRARRFAICPEPHEVYATLQGHGVRMASDNVAEAAAAEGFRRQPAVHADLDS